MLGLASVALLWPLSALTGMGGGAPRALVILGLSAAIWIGVVGFGRVGRPVLTLTLTGVAYGLIALLISAIVAPGSGILTGGGPAWSILPALAMDALWGFLAGLAAAGIQKLRRAR